jgi:hypothetical protein
MKTRRYTILILTCNQNKTTHNIRFAKPGLGNIG